MLSRQRRWLLPQPLRLPVRGHRPWYEGPLRLLTRRQRIETGWWDGGDVRRDYYVATSPGGLRLWVFEDQRSRGWYLHGLFG